VSVSRIVLPDAGEGGGCSADAWGRGGPRAICGLVRKDAARKRRTAGHLRPCAERRRAEAADRGPSVALCGKILEPETGCRAICGLVRKDAARKRRTAGHLWPCAERCLGRSGGPRAICGQRTVGSASDSR
jgi:hypothetical protein